MTILKIYRLEDSEESEPLSSLSDGEHIIGRGFLNCNDKRVSRKHARIIIENDTVTIKSEHINPCFHKPSVSNSISILPKDKSVVLNNNDQFALLSDNFWFKVKVIRDDEKQCNSNTKVLGNNINNNEALNVVTPFKRNNDGSNNSSPSKKQRTSYGTILKCTETGHTAVSSLLTNLESIHEDYGGNEANNSSIEANNSLNEANDSLNEADYSLNEIHYSLNEANNSVNETAHRSNETEQVADDDYFNNGNKGPTDTFNKKNQPGNSEENDVKPKLKTINVNLPISEEKGSSSVDQKERDNTTNVTIKTENIEESTSVNESDATNSEIAHDDVKKEPDIEADKVMNITDNVDNAANIVNNATTNLNNATSNLNNSTSNLNNATDATDNSSNLRTRRDRCWYGQSCYRKNPQHRIDLSHPGDDDYDSDPNDDRPNCPFGNACYRANLEHRREFKHRGKPGPKPNDAGPSSPGTSTQATKPKKKRTKKKKQPQTDNSEESGVDSAATSDSDQNNASKKKRKAAPTNLKLDTPEDDYDYTDPFIDDATDEEFQLSDADDDDESDWQDSQEADEESQETRRLLREAKKFTRRKK